MLLKKCLLKQWRGESLNGIQSIGCVLLCLGVIWLVDQDILSFSSVFASMCDMSIGSLETWFVWRKFEGQ